MDKKPTKQELDEALARMRAAFADLSEEQIMEDVARIIEADRQEQRQKEQRRQTEAPTSP